MNKNRGSNVPRKVLIVHVHGVSDKTKERVQKMYPDALVKAVHAADVIKEAIEFKKRVTHVICLPGVDDIESIVALWPGCTEIKINTSAET